MGKRRKRLDELLVERGLAANRSQAKGLILAGKVRNGTTVLDKAGKEWPLDIDLEVEDRSPYVSRGAEKLAGFFKAYPLKVEGLCFLDLGASTGGFTDYLLQAGAAGGTCVDVGHGQLHYKLRTDTRVRNLERVNARHLQPGDLPHSAYPLIVMDLSFISLRLILPAAWPFLEQEGRLIALVKPQFEAGREEADRSRGVITDADLRQRILAEILKFAENNLPGSRCVGWCASPIAGASGNREYLVGWEKGAGAHS